MAQTAGTRRVAGARRPPDAGLGLAAAQRGSSHASATTVRAAYGRASAGQVDSAGRDVAGGSVESYAGRSSRAASPLGAVEPRDRGSVGQ